MLNVLRVFLKKCNFFVKLLIEQNISVILERDDKWQNIF